MYFVFEYILLHLNRTWYDWFLSLHLTENPHYIKFKAVHFCPSTLTPLSRFENNRRDGLAVKNFPECASRRLPLCLDRSKETKKQTKGFPCPVLHRVVL